MTDRGRGSNTQLLQLNGTRMAAGEQRKKSKADAQKPYIEGGQEGTDKGFHYLKGRERHTLEDKQEHQPQRGNPCKH